MESAVCHEKNCGRREGGREGGREGREGRGVGTFKETPRWGPAGWKPEGGGAQNFALFFILPPVSLFVSLSVSSRGILVVFEAPGP